MGIEIERKFLVCSEDWRSAASQKIPIRQGYLSIEPNRTVRVRIWGDTGKLTVKSKAIQASRMEFEYDIPTSDAIEMLDQLCPFPQIEKTRFLVPHGDHLWEVDVFDGHNTGLILAEIELSSVQDTFEKPSWIGKEVTSDNRYSNSYLSRHSFHDFS